MEDNSDEKDILCIGSRNEEFSSDESLCYTEDTSPVGRPLNAGRPLKAAGGLSGGGGASPDMFTLSQDSQDSLVT